MIVRAEREGEEAAIAAIHRAAFGGEYEAEVVAGLRAGGHAFASLVAERDGAVAGHVMMSAMEAEIDGRTVPIALLAPLAVTPEAHGRGLGSALVRAGIAAARDAGRETIVLMGNPAYYRRFGFTPAASGALGAPYVALDPAAALAGQAGHIRYPGFFRRIS